MTTINSNRITGLATGMDIDEMITNMLTGEQNKIDKAEQKKTTQTWQQEIYRDVISDVKGLYDKYFSVSSADCILSSKAFNTLTINSSNSNVITATGGAGASTVNYQFEVSQLAEAPKMSSSVNAKDSTLESLGLKGEVTFKLNYGEDKNSKSITIEPTDTVDSLMKKINESTDGEIKASFSEMTGTFSIETKATGKNSTLSVVDGDGKASDALGFLGLKDLDGNEVIDGATSGKNNEVNVFDSKGNLIKSITEESNSFTIDGITYKVNGVSSEKVSITSTTDTKSTVEGVKAFLDDYNSMMDSIYDLVTQKKNNDYPPLTEAQKEEMTEKEIENWESKAKAGILRNDSEMRSFMDSIKSALMGEIGGLGISLSDIGIESHTDYNKPGQLVLNEEKFTKALEENGEQVYEVFTTAFENVKKVTYDYAGSSSSIFAKKAGIEKTASVVNNLFSEQIKQQETYIKKLVNKMQEKQEKLYLKFANLESSMNKLNSQMNYLISSLS